MIVKCPQCKISYYETTETFNPDVLPNGAMLRLRDPWRKMGWYTYGLDRGDGASLLSSDMECVGCSAPLAPSGRLMVVGPPEPVKELRPWPPQLSKADKIRGHLLTATTSHSKIAELVGTSPQYVSNVARKMKNG